MNSKRIHLKKKIIEDNGKGIDGLINKGSGLNIMKERARLIDGKLKINSQLGRGTKIIVTFSI